MEVRLITTVIQQTLVGKNIGGFGGSKKFGGFLPHQPLLDDCNRV